MDETEGKRTHAGGKAKAMFTRGIADAHQEGRSIAFYLLVVAILIFTIEFGIMFLFFQKADANPVAEEILDAAMLTAMITPLFYFLVFRPLNSQSRARRQSEERLLMLKQAIESMQLGVSVTDIDGRIIYCNPAEAEMHGYSPEELIGKKAHIFSPPERWKELSRNELMQISNWKRERYNIRKDGSSFPVQLISNLVLNAEGEPIGTITNCEDITKRKNAEQALQKSEARYRSLVESTEDSIYLVDRDFRYIYMNRQHLKRLGVTNEDIIGKQYSEFHNRAATLDFINKVQGVFDTGISTQHEHHSNRDGRYFLRTLSPVRDVNGDIFAITVISKDITERKRMEDKLRALSLTDDLTGLYNRRGLKALGEQQIKLANRLKKKVVMLYADVDDLKKINDSLGHNEGDRLLVSTANLLRDTFRNSDIIARIGGDEFVCMSVDMEEASGAAVHSRVSEKIDEFNRQQNLAYDLSVSFGISYYDPEDPCSLDELLEKADKSMYQLKKNRQKP